MDIFNDLNFWSVFGTFLAILIALIIAIWGEWLKSIFFKPKLEFHYEHKWPDALKIPLKQMNLPIPNSDESKGFGLCYFFRFRLKNNGNRTAHDVEVIVKNIEQKILKGGFEKYQKFIPLNLGWAFESNKKNIDRIIPGMEKHCDLGYILHPQQEQIIEMIERDNQQGNPFNSASNILFIISFVVKPNVKQSYVLPPGHYRIELAAIAANAKMKTKIFELKFREKWFDDFEEMMANVIIKRHK